MRGEVLILWLLFFWIVSLPIVLIFWWKKRKAKKSAGENFLNDEKYQSVARKKNYADNASIILFLLTTFSGIFFQRTLEGILFFWFLCLWIASVVAFIYLWWKKRNARLAAGENYAEDENYKKISRTKKIIGVASVAVFILFTQVIRNPELLLTSSEIAEIELERKQAREEFISKLEGNEKIFYDEKFAAYIAEGKSEDYSKFLAVQDVKNKKSADEKLAAEEKLAADKKAEEEKLAADKKAEEEKLAAEKKAAEEKLAAEKKAAEEKLAAEKKAEEEKLAAEKKAEEEKLAAEKKAAEEKIVAEKNSADEEFEATKKTGLEPIDEYLEKIDEFKKRKNDVEKSAKDAIYVAKGSTLDEIGYDLYILPDTAKRFEHGIIFKDYGYKIDVIEKNSQTGEIRSSNVSDLNLKVPITITYRFYVDNISLTPEDKIEYDEILAKTQKWWDKRNLAKHDTALAIYRASKEFFSLTLPMEKEKIY